MIPRIDRESLRCAEEVFRTVAIAINCVQTYTENHPRYGEAIKRLGGLVEEYFLKNSESQHMTFLADGKRVEFRKIPLMNVGSHGDRLVKLLASCGLGGLQIQRGISAEDIGTMVRDLVWHVPERQTRSEESPPGNPARGQDPDRGAISDAAAHSGVNARKKATCHLISKTAAEQMQMDWPVATTEGEEGAEDTLGIPEFQVIEETARSLLTSYKTFLARPEEGLIMNHGLLKDTVDHAMSLMSGSQYQTATNASMGYFDDFTFHHSVNVCLLTASVARTIFADGEMLRRISLAALLHDVGKSRIPVDILHKPGKLTDAEFDVMKGHPIFGAEILLGVEKIDPLCINVAFAHHLLNENLKYPKTRSTFRCDWITKLISVVDIYEALTAVRPYKKGLSPKTAFQVMLSMPGLEKSLDLVKFVYDCLGPYPVGAIVELSTGERAMVTSSNPSDLHRPKVRVFTDSKRNLLSTPVDLDLTDPARPGSGEDVPKISRTIVRQSVSESPWEADVIPEPKEILGAPLHDDQTLMGREG